MGKSYHFKDSDPRRVRAAASNLMRRATTYGRQSQYEMVRLQDGRIIGIVTVCGLPVPALDDLARTLRSELDG